MDSDIQSIVKIGFEGAGCLLIVVIAWKIYKMKIHSKSGCCGDKFIIETLNKAGSSSNLEFSNVPRTPDNVEQKEFIL